MKEFLKIMEKDYLKENFSTADWLIYGILYPMVLVLTIAVISILEDMVNNNLL